ncbi:MAG: hypothetical protein AAB410_01915 [Patescibacteria group bacterium]
MTEAVITKLKSDTITLPKTWKGSRVLLRVTGNTATITKLKKSGDIFSKSQVAAMRGLGKKISKATLKKALAK